MAESCDPRPDCSRHGDSRTKVVAVGDSDVATPTGTVTFLFTDIEGSAPSGRTDLTTCLPWLQSMMLGSGRRSRTTVGMCSRTGGDGFAAAFGHAADAVAAAERAQAAIKDLPDIRVRMELNTGEVQERGGDDFGPAVNRTARLMAVAHGGQVLLAAVTAELVPGLALRNLGEHRLSDLGSPMVVLQLGAEEFPPLRTLDELPGNLPHQLTSFVGRDHGGGNDCRAVGRKPVGDATGVGGVGKTRLALQVAAEVVLQFPDGAWLSAGFRG